MGESAERDVPVPAVLGSALEVGEADALHTPRWSAISQTIMPHRAYPPVLLAHLEPTSRIGDDHSGQLSGF